MEEVKKELMKLGLSDSEAQKTVSDRAGYIDSAVTIEELSPREIAHNIWGELVNPFAGIEI